MHTAKLSAPSADHTPLTIRESTDAEGPVILVDTIGDYDLAIATYDLPIIVPEALADELGFPTKPHSPVVAAAFLGTPRPRARGDSCGGAARAKTGASSAAARSA